MRILYPKLCNMAHAFRVFSLLSKELILKFYLHHQKEEKSVSSKGMYFVVVG